MREGRTARIVRRLGGERCGVEKRGHGRFLWKCGHGHWTTFEAARKFRLDESLAESLWCSRDKRAVQISREVIYSVLLVLGRVVRSVELVAELLTVEQGKEVSLGGDRSCVRGGGKDKSWVIFCSVEIGVVLYCRWGRDG